MSKVLDIFSRNQKIEEPKPIACNCHCDYCHIPIEIWEPLKTYNSKRSCEVYDDFYNIIWDLEVTLKYNYNTIFNRCKGFSEKYPDLSDIEETVRELIEIGLNTGIITAKYNPLRIA